MIYSQVNLFWANSTHANEGEDKVVVLASWDRRNRADLANFGVTDDKAA